MEQQKGYKIQHTTSSLEGMIREVVFGMEDGMVSTLGSVTGIAVGSGNHSTVVLAGLVIIAVESISMGIGSYLSNRSEEEVSDRKLAEEKSEITNYPLEEKEELRQMYVEDGWPTKLAQEMSETVSQNPSLMLKEMALRELKIFPSSDSVSIKGGFYMFGSYILGGLLPLASYLFLPINNAIPTSIVLTLIGLFGIGAFATKFTKQPVIKSGIKMLVVGGIALIVGLVVGVSVK